MNQIMRSWRGNPRNSFLQYIYEIRQSIFKKIHTGYTHKLLRIPQMSKAPHLPQLPLQMDQRLLS